MWFFSWSKCLSICCLSTFIFLSWSTKPISTKLGTKHSCIKIIQVCSNFFQRGDLKMFSSRTIGPISTKLCTRHISWKRLKFVQIKGHTFLQGEIMVKINALTIFKNLLLRNHIAPFNQTGHKAFFGKDNSSLYKWRAMRFSNGIL